MISAVIISKNEVDRIGDCIESLKTLTDDIIVMDSGSTDGTQELCKSLGAQLINTEWKGYGPTKNEGNKKAKYDWILSIDADERLTDNLATEISALQLDSDMVYSINRQNFYLGTQINHSGWSPDWVPRIFDRNRVKWNDNLVHEKLMIPKTMKTVRLQARMIHHSYRSIQDHKDKIENYAALRAKIWLEKGKHPNPIKRFFGPFFKGFKSYILKLGFLDGKAGWMIARMNSHLVKRQIHHFDNFKKPQL